MGDPQTRKQYIEGEIEALAPFDFVAIGPAERAFHMSEVCRCNEGGLEVRIPGRPPIVPSLSESEREALREHGFNSEDPDNATIAWLRSVASASEAFELVQLVIHQIFEEPKDTRYDIFHGNHRAEHEAKEKLAEVRGRVERVITEKLGGAPEQDADGDYLLAVGDVQVAVSPRTAPGGPTLVRVFAITNVGANVTPDLGLLLARLNFSLAYGRFGLDVDRRTILFDETLLGDPLNEEALRFAIDVVAQTADEWDDRLKQMFGGMTYQEFLKQEKGKPKELPAKPGQSESKRTELGLYL